MGSGGESDPEDASWSLLLMLSSAQPQRPLLSIGKRGCHSHPSSEVHSVGPGPHRFVRQGAAGGAGEHDSSFSEDPC